MQGIAPFGQENVEREAAARIRHFEQLPGRALRVPKSAGLMHKVDLFFTAADSLERFRACIGAEKGLLPFAKEPGSAGHDKARPYVQRPRAEQLADSPVG